MWEVFFFGTARRIESQMPERISGTLRLKAGGMATPADRTRHWNNVETVLDEAVDCAVKRRGRTAAEEKSVRAAMMGVFG